MRRRSLIVVGSIVLLFLLEGCMFMPPQKTTPTSKPSVTREQIDWNEMINLYMYKDVSSVGSVEGIYSISGLVTRTGKGFLGAGEEKEKVVDRKENYAKVAIIRDPARTSREFVELLMDGETTTSMDVIGEFSSMSKGNIMVYKHFDQKGKEFDTYTFTYDQDKDFLEGVRTETKGNATITYKLTYLKILPKR